MTEDEFRGVLEGQGFSRTGRTTKLIEEWCRESDGACIYVTKASELSPAERAESRDYILKTLGVGFPKGPRVH